MSSKFPVLFITYQTTTTATYTTKQVSMMSFSTSLCVHFVLKVTKFLRQHAIPQIRMLLCGAWQTQLIFKVFKETCNPQCDCNIADLLWLVPPDTIPQRTPLSAWEKQIHFNGVWPMGVQTFSSIIFLFFSTVPTQVSWNALPSG